MTRLLLFLVVATAFGLSGQSRLDTSPLAFEVVSIKPAIPAGNTSGCRGIDSKLRPNDSRTNVPLGGCVYNSGTLRQLINQAYALQAVGAIRGVPEWDRASLYRIDARAENPSTTTEKQLFGMLQTMLAERFKLKYHWETSEVQGFALVVDRKGHKLQKSRVDNDSSWLLYRV